MENESTPQRHRTLYPGMNGIRTDLLLMTSQRRPAPENHVEASSTNGQESHNVPQQSETTESDTVPQQSQDPPN